VLANFVVPVTPLPSELIPAIPGPVLVLLPAIHAEANAQFVTANETALAERATAVLFAGALSICEACTSGNGWIRDEPPLHAVIATNPVAQTAAEIVRNSITAAPPPNETRATSIETIDAAGAALKQYITMAWFSLNRYSTVILSLSTVILSLSKGG
jgi:hypothetical protein